MTACVHYSYSAHTIVILLFDLVPGAPGDITYQILTDTVIQFSWSPPDSPNDVINGYQVIYRGYSVNQTVDGLIIVSG